MPEPIYNSKRSQLLLRGSLQLLSEALESASTSCDMLLAYPASIALQCYHE